MEESEVNIIIAWFEHVQHIRQRDQAASSL